MLGYCQECKKMVQPMKLRQVSLPNGHRAYEGQCAICDAPILKSAEKQFREDLSKSNKQGRKHIWKGLRPSLAIRTRRNRINRKQEDLNLKGSNDAKIHV